MRILIAVLLMLTVGASHAQDYTVIQTMPNAIGQPGDMLMPMVHVQNSSSEGILMRLERIVLNLPTNWTSCFCYPHCIAPWIDTMTFMIPGLSMDSITPNFCTDSFVSGSGTVQIILYQVGFESVVDTITFTGTTLPNSVTENRTEFTTSVFPNPLTHVTTISHDNPAGFWIIVTDLHGKVVFAPATVYILSVDVDLSFLNSGSYIIEVHSSSGDRIRVPVIKANN